MTQKQKGERPLGLAMAGRWPCRAWSLWHIECHDKNTVDSERDLIRIPRLQRDRLMRLVEVISFQVCGLTHESRGVGPEKGKASAHADRSWAVTSLHMEKTFTRALTFKSSHKESNIATDSGSGNFCLSQAAMRCVQRGAVHSDRVTSDETEGDQWSSLMVDKM